MMDYEAILSQVVALLEREGRLAYRVLKRRLQLDDDLQERVERYGLTGPLPPLAIPTTLHDSLMAQLDRLAVGKGLAQLAATLGRACGG
jgi:hypothetical protein